MGFFTDLKEDLSQAAGELTAEALTPEELLLEADAEAAAQEMDLSAALDSALEALDETALPEEDAAAFDVAFNMDEALAVEPEDVEAVDYPAPDEPGDDFMAEENNINEGEEIMNEDAIYVATAEAEMMKTEMAGKRVSDETAVITGGMSIAGDISSEGSLELEGSVNGNIDILGKLNITGAVNGDSKAAEIFADNAKITGEVRSMGSVKIGQSTIIIGNIFASSAVIAGAVKGDIDVMGPVILDTSAIVMGNIKSKSVQINNGAVIEGMCSQSYAEVNPTSFFDEIKKGKKG